MEWDLQPLGLQFELGEGQLTPHINFLMQIALLTAAPIQGRNTDTYRSAVNLCFVFPQNTFCESFIAHGERVIRSYSCDNRYEQVSGTVRKAAGTKNVVLRKIGRRKD